MSLTIGELTLGGEIVLLKQLRYAVLSGGGLQLQVTVAGVVVESKRHGELLVDCRSHFSRLN